MFHRPDHVLELDERHLHVELGEFGLAIGAEVFIAEASGDLEIAVVAGDHQDLLVKLRRLRESVEMAGMEAAGDEEIAGAFGRGAAEHGGLDLDEPQAAHGVAHHLGHLVTHQQDALHLRPAEVQVAIGEPQFLVRLAASGDLEGGRLSAGEDFERIGLDLDGAGLKLRILLAGEAFGDRALHADHIFGAEVVGGLHQIGAGIGVEDDLGHAVAIPQIDEDEAAVIAAGVYPTVEDHGSSGMVGAQLAAGVGPLQHERSRGRSAGGQDRDTSFGREDLPYPGRLGSVKPPSDPPQGPSPSNDGGRRPSPVLRQHEPEPARPGEPGRVLLAGAFVGSILMGTSSDDGARASRKDRGLLATKRPSRGGRAASQVSPRPL